MILVSIFKALFPAPVAPPAPLLKSRAHLKRAQTIRERENAKRDAMTARLRAEIKARKA